MSCVNPSYVEGVIDDYTGLIRYKFFGHGRYLKVSDFGSIDDLIDGKRVRIPVPCRTCLGCRIDYSREWANRMCLEMLCSGQACFITLTYNNSSLPLTKDLIPTLCKRDWQLFMKRLRKAFPDRKLRFYMCGEYGSHTLRPHYHAIIFGLDIFAFPDLKYLKKSEIGSLYFSSPKLEKIWSKGFCLIAECNFRTCAYVSRYTLKKHFGSSKSELRGALPEFTLSSRRPGIGLDPSLLDKFQGDFFDIPLSDGVQHIRVPRSFIKKFTSSSSCLVDSCQKIFDRLNFIRYTLLRDLNSDIVSQLNFSGHKKDH